jgi:hypothetical protein
VNESPAGVLVHCGAGALGARRDGQVSGELAVFDPVEEVADSIRRRETLVEPPVDVSLAALAQTHALCVKKTAQGDGGQQALLGVSGWVVGRFEAAARSRVRRKTRHVA